MNLVIKNKFSYIILGSTILVGGIIYALHLLGFVTPANEVYARFIALGIFVAGFIFLSWQKAKHHHFSLNDLYKNSTLIIISLTVLLCSLFILSKISYYAIGFFVLASLLHFIYTKKFYAPPKFVYSLFVYALLMFFGTIGTSKGFHFPDSILSFFVLPLAFCCFKLEKKTLLKISEIFFKTGIIFLMICALYWFYNFLHLDTDFTDWITKKTNYTAQMIGWTEQAKITLGHLFYNVNDLQNVQYFNAYFFVDSWSQILHPTKISIYLSGGLTVGFYLYFQKNDFSTISKLDLILYNALCLFVILLLQSRIGTVGFVLTVGISSLYYLKIKTGFFKTGFVICILLAGASVFVFNNKISSFANDDIRSYYRQIGINYIEEHFWWGSGFEQQRAALEAQAEKIKDLPDSVNFVSYPIHHVHNQFLGDMVQFGIFGLIALLAMLVSIAYYAVKNRSYLLQTFLCFILCFMMIEVGEFILILTFIMFFAAISESEKRQIKFSRL